MSYDPYDDPYNLVRKSDKPDLGSGNGGGNFEYGSSRDIPVNTPDDGVVEGTTNVSRAVVNWDKDGDGSTAVAADYIQGPYQETSG